MTATRSLADVLQEHTRSAPYTVTPGLLAKLAGLPKSTIINWLDGRVARPRRWEDLLRVADALRLSEAESNELLEAAGHPPLADLRAQVGPSPLFRLWPMAPPAAAGAAPAGLPTPATPLLGRAAEHAQLCDLLRQPSVRLVTLTGTGGCGKTRLALQVAATLGPEFADGACFVPLAPLLDAGLVLPTIALALGLKVGGDAPALAQVREALQRRWVLLLLDNFEHLTAAGAEVAALLAGAPQAKILITSRAVLHIYGEHVVPLAPLPAPARDSRPESLAANPAVALFVQRAQAVDPSFQLSEANARLVAEICARLDGLPLSIELAAARVRLLSPSGLLARMGNRLGLLSWGSHNLLQRHRSLRETLDWSYGLLNPAAQALFCQMAVFMGGCSAEALEAVAGGDILDALMALTDGSMVQTATRLGERRYQMLETLREYAAERLAARADRSAVRARHAAHYLQLAEAAEPLLMGPVQVEWLARLDGERDNLRAAMRHALDAGDGETAGRLASCLRLYWMVRGPLGEGRRWLAEALAAPGGLPALGQAKMLFVAGRLARQQGDLEAAAAQIAGALAIYRAQGDSQGVASALGALGVVAYDRGAFEQASALHEESLDLRRSLNDRWGVAATLTNLGEVRRQQGELSRSQELHVEGLALFRALDDARGTAMALLNLGQVLLDTGAIERAAALLHESLTLWYRVGDLVDSAECLEALARLAAAHADSERAARLYGAAAAQRQAAAAALSPVDHARGEQLLGMLAERLGPQRLATAIAAGGALTLAQAVAYALPDDDDAD
jgi:predicted ATPase